MLGQIAAFTVAAVVIHGLAGPRHGARRAAGAHRRLATRRRARTSFAQGFLNNVLNPKPALFYLAFLPQFIRAGDPVVMMTATLVAIHIALGIVWLVTWGGSSGAPEPRSDSRGGGRGWSA